MRIYRIWTLLLALWLAAAGLGGCAEQRVLDQVTLSPTVLQPTGKGETVDISYTIDRPTKIWVYLQDGQGARYTLRSGEQRVASSEPYVLRFDGTAPTEGDATLLRRRLPNGSYQVQVEAEDAGGQRISRQAAQPLTITGENAPPPVVQNLVVLPAAISPNADGIDDVAEITYQLPVTATVDISVSGPDCSGQGCPSYPVVTASEEGPTPQRHVWNGKTIDGIILPDGRYTYTLRAADRFGNLAQHTGTITIAGAGQPEATITSSTIAPEQLMLGGVLTVTVRVKNTGSVPIRTYGPASGYEYSTRQVFSSVEDGKYDAKSGGFWRVGADWDANSGGARRYPFRWSISPRPPAQWKVPFVEDVLMPGEEAEVVGRIRVEQPETKMTFYVGLIWDGVGFRQDRSGRTLIKVGF